MTDMSPAYRDRTAHVRGAARDHLRKLREERIAAREAARGPEEKATPQADLPAEIAESAPENTFETGGEAQLEAAPTAAPEVPAAPPVAPARQNASAQAPLSPKMKRLLEARKTPAAPEPLAPEPVAAVPVAPEPVAEAVAQPDSDPAPIAAAEIVPEVEVGPALEPAPTALLAVEDAPLSDEVLPGFDTPEPEAEEEPAPVLTAEPAPEAPMAQTPAAPDLDRLPGAGPGLIWMLNECEIHTLADLAAADCEALTARMGLAGRILDLGGWIDFARNAQAETAAR